MEPSLPPLVVPSCSATPRARASRTRESTYAGGVTDELSTARATAPAPIGATAKLGSSSGESAETNVSIAWTRRGAVPSAAAATPAPSSPISSRTLQMNITWCFTAPRLELERAVVADGGHPEPDLVHVRHEHDQRVPLTDAHPQVARAVGLALGPRRQEALHQLADRALRAGDAVGFHEGCQDGLRLGDPGRVLGGQADGRTGGQKKEREHTISDRPHLPSIHCSISRISLSTSASATVSTAVSVYRVGRLAVLMSSNGPSRAFTPASPELPAYRLCTVNATTTVPFVLSLACTAATRAAHAARRPAPGPARSRSPDGSGRVVSATGASTSTPSARASAAEAAPTST